MEAEVGFAVHSATRNIGYSLPNNASIFTAEIAAIMYATLIIKTSTNKYHVICTDSRSCVEALSNYEHPNHLVMKTKTLISKLVSKGNHIEICWIPSHTGLKANETVDELAKNAIQAPLCNECIPVSDYFDILKNQMIQQWRNQWENESQHNKLKKIKPDVLKWNSSIQTSRKLEVILTRLRIGHTKLTHSYLMKSPRENKPMCNSCNKELTIEHIFNECKENERERIQHFGMNKLKEILKDRPNFQIIKIVNFLKKTQIIEEI